tara:strand:+ start:873 stop:1682 length:810 start_codon:yes stop_codon:yes gene_type:complete
MIVNKLIVNFITPVALFFSNLDYMKIVSQNPNNIFTLTQKNKGIEKLVNENDIIFFGEAHSEANDKLKLEVLINNIRNIDKEGEIGLGLEMVSSDKQIILDEFNDGKINSDILMKKLNWDNEWRYQKESYELIFNNARSHNMNLIGLNAPERLLNIFKDGVKFNKNYIEDDNLISFIKTIGEYHNLADKKTISKYYQINLLWETWMSSEIENYLRLFPGSKIVVFTGGQHSKYSGIPKILEKNFPNRFSYVNITPYIDKDYFGKISTEK